jgi:hypothetical protein
MQKSLPSSHQFLEEKKKVLFSTKKKKVPLKKKKRLMCEHSKNKPLEMVIFTRNDVLQRREKKQSDT